MGAQRQSPSQGVAAKQSCRPAAHIEAVASTFRPHSSDLKTADAGEDTQLVGAHDYPGHMWIWTVIATITGLGGLALGLRNYRHMRHAPVRDKQAKVRSNLKQTLQLVDYHQLEKTINQLETRMPSPQIDDELRGLREYLLLHKDEFIAPTPDHLLALVETVDTTLADHDAARHLPIDDAILTPDGDAASRQRLQEDFALLRRQVRCIVDGINEIDKNAFSVRRQKDLFKMLQTSAPRRELAASRTPREILHQ